MPRTAKALTDTAVKNARPVKGQTGWRDISDGAVRGLKLRVTANGDKYWSLVVQVGNGRRRHELGAYPAISLSEARNRARQYAAAASDGLSPDEYDRRRRADKLSLRDAHAAYLEAVTQQLTSRWVDLKVSMFRDHVPTTLADKPIKQIRRADLIELNGRIVKKGYNTQANRVVTEVMACLRWCAENDWIESVPTLGSRVRQRETARDRTLTDYELADMWIKLETLTPIVSDFLALLMLTGQRRDEVRKIHCSEIDRHSRVWTIPADRYKTGRAHTVPLGDGAWAIVERRLANAAGGYLLPHRDGSQKPWNGTRNAMEQVRRAVQGSPDYTLHDIRRTVRTGLVRLGVSVDVAEAVIGHAPQGIIKVYDRYDRMEERRAALNAWEQQLLTLAQQGHRYSNVVRFDTLAS